MAQARFSMALVLALSLLLSPWAPAVARDDAVVASINLKRVELRDLVATMSAVLERKIELSPASDLVVDMHVRGPISPPEAYCVFKSVLAAYGFVLVDRPDGSLLVAPSRGSTVLLNCPKEPVIDDPGLTLAAAVVTLEQDAVLFVVDSIERTDNRSARSRDAADSSPRGGAPSDWEVVGRVERALRGDLRSGAPVVLRLSAIGEQSGLTVGSTYLASLEREDGGLRVAAPGYVFAWGRALAEELEGLLAP